MRFRLVAFRAEVLRLLLHEHPVEILLLLDSPLAFDGLLRLVLVGRHVSHLVHVLMRFLDLLNLQREGN